MQKLNKNKDYLINKKTLIQNHVYSENDEHSSCGVGLIASISGLPSRKIVEMGVQALKVLYHRGAVDADGKTGDGAGIQLGIPKDFFKEKINRSGHKLNNFPFAVGMIFLPRTNFEAQEKARIIIESEIIKEGFKIFGWRHVPINTKIIGEKAKASLPEIEQILIGNEIFKNELEFDDKLFLIRKRIEKKILMIFIFAHYHASQLFIKECFLQNSYQTFIQIFRIKDLFQTLPSTIKGIRLILFLHGL